MHAEKVTMVVLPCYLERLPVEPEAWQTLDYSEGTDRHHKQQLASFSASVISAYFQSFAPAT